jgi:hypothetical protein
MRPMATTSATARSTMPPVPPRWSTLAEAHAKRRRPANAALVFLAVTAEEIGPARRSYYYAANPVFPLAQTVGGVNMDALQMAGPAQGCHGRGRSGQERRSTRYPRAPRSSADRPHREPRSQARSVAITTARTISAFAKLGVPMLYIDGGRGPDRRRSRAAGRSGHPRTTPTIAITRPMMRTNSTRRWDWHRGVICRPPALLPPGRG